MLSVESVWVSKKSVGLALLAHRVFLVKIRLPVGIMGPKKIGASQRVNMSSCELICQVIPWGPSFSIKLGRNNVK